MSSDSSYCKSGSKLLSFIVMILITRAFTGISLMAQDFHFSQFYAAPLLTNPASTGMSGENLRATINYRNQWAKVGVPFETVSASIDSKAIIMNQILGIGGAVIHDQSSSFNLTANKLMLSFSFSKIINNQQFTIGIQPGFVSKTFDLKGLTFGTQFNTSGGIFDETLPSLENGLSDKVGYFDLNAGIFWRSLIRYVMPAAGIAVSHVNMPVEKFSTSTTGNRLPLRLTFNGEVIIPLTSKIEMTPYLLYSYTPGANEFLTGSEGSYSVGEFSIPVKEIYAIALVRLNPVRDIDALILGAGAKFLGFNLGFSYDFNISPLRSATNFNGAFEISLIYTGAKRAQDGSGLPCFILN